MSTSLSSSRHCKGVEIDSQPELQQFFPDVADIEGPHMQLQISLEGCATLYEHPACAQEVIHPHRG